MTINELNANGFIVNGRKIEKLTYQEYLNEYGQDLITSPRGVEDRMHIREKEVEPACSCEQTNDDGYVLHEDNCPCLSPDKVIEYQIWSWGVNGNNPYYTGTSFDNEEEAELYYYERSEWYVREKNWDAPRFHTSYDEAIADMADSLDRREDVIRRYIALSTIPA